MRGSYCALCPAFITGLLTPEVCVWPASITGMLTPSSLAYSPPSTLRLDHWPGLFTPEVCVVKWVNCCGQTGCPTRSYCALCPAFITGMRPPSPCVVKRVKLVHRSNSLLLIEWTSLLVCGQTAFSAPHPLSPTCPPPRCVVKSDLAATWSNSPHSGQTALTVYRCIKSCVTRVCGGGGRRRMQAKP